jgi:PIF1-like helicase
MFTLHSQPDRVRITASTGIAAENICGSTIHSLLSLLNEDLSGSRLNSLQMSLAEVRLLVIDEYSFLSIPLFAALDRQLQKNFPAKADKLFSGMNIVLCRDPTQLAPVRGQPVYERQTNGCPQPTCFHLFQTVVELDQPFQQTGTDTTQVCFRELLQRVVHCHTDEHDWQWL